MQRKENPAIGEGLGEREMGAGRERSEREERREREGKAERAWGDPPGQIRELSYT